MNEQETIKRQNEIIGELTTENRRLYEVEKGLREYINEIVFKVGYDKIAKQFDSDSAIQLMTERFVKYEAFYKEHNPK